MQDKNQFVSYEMKPFVLFLLILITAVSCSTDKKEAPSKTLIESRMLQYKYIYGRLDSTGLLHERILFDRQGRDSLIEKYDNDGLLFISTVSYYDSTGNKIKDMDYKPDGKVESKTDNKYSKNGLIIESNTERVDGGYYREKFIYNERGQKIKEISSSKHYYDYLDKWFTTNRTTLFFYNDKGYFVGEKESVDGGMFKDTKAKFDSVGNKIYEDWGSNIRKSSYDKNGNIIEHLSLDENEKLVWRWVSKYDSNNVLIEYKTFNSLNEPVEVLKKEFIYK